MPDQTILRILLPAGTDLPIAYSMHHKTVFNVHDFNYWLCDNASSQWPIFNLNDDVFGVDNAPQLDDLVSIGFSSK